MKGQRDGRVANRRNQMHLPSAHAQGIRSDLGIASEPRNDYQQISGSQEHSGRRLQKHEEQTLMDE